MHQIYITAFVTKLPEVLLIGGLIKLKSGKENFKLVLVLFLI